MPPRKKASKPLDRTSSLNKYFLCDKCDKKFAKKCFLRSHDCVKKSLKSVTCRWCNVSFIGKGNLANHARNVHGDMSYNKISSKPSSEIVKCNVCSKMFAELFQLRYHIRRQHFNLKSKLPYWLQKKVNQVWFEKVLNCNNVMEIRKAGPNTLVMRRLAENSALRVADADTEEVDVTHLYPTGPKSLSQKADVSKVDMEAYRQFIKQDVNSTALLRITTLWYEAVTCKICSKRYGRRNLSKHMKEVHSDSRVHHCNKCKLQFKRLYLFLRHVCNKKKKPRGGRSPFTLGAQ